MANSTLCQCKWKPIVEPRRAKPKTYRQDPTHWLKIYEEAVIESEAQSIGFIPNLKKVRFETSSAIHLHRDRISDTTNTYTQGTTRSYRIPTSDYQTISNSDSSFSTNFPFSFGQTKCSSRLSCSRQTSFTTTTNVFLICLEISYSTTGSSSSDKQYYPITF